LQVPERIQFRLCVLVYRCLNFTASPYLAEPETLRQSTDIDACRRLRSAAISTLIVPSTRHITLGDRTFLVAAACAWNGLPSSLRAASSLRSSVLPGTEDVAVFIVIWHSRLTAETAFAFSFSLLSAPATVILWQRHSNQYIL